MSKGRYWGTAFDSTGSRESNPKSDAACQEAKNLATTLARLDELMDTQTEREREREREAKRNAAKEQPRSDKAAAIDRLVLAEKHIPNYRRAR
jgi:hypothetical protein